jgi:hypothetical protein
LKGTRYPVRAQPPRHGLPAVVGRQGHAAAAISEERTGATVGKLESHHGPCDTAVIGVFHAYDWFLRTGRSDVVDGAVTFQDNQVKRTVLRRQAQIDNKECH